eukprot:3582984-Rhodomonas_salina.1
MSHRDCHHRLRDCGSGAQAPGSQAQFSACHGTQVPHLSAPAGRRVTGGPPGRPGVTVAP